MTVVGIVALISRRFGRAELASSTYPMILTLLLLLPFPQDSHGHGDHDPPREDEGPPTPDLDQEQDAPPAFEFAGVLDLMVDYRDADTGDEGLDLSLRALEFSASTWIDPTLEAYAVMVADEDQVVLEEAAVHYLGLGDDVSLRAGRFFAEFGPSMHLHVHELRFPERPGVLRAYLGEELVGTGVQFDHRWRLGGKKALRLSLAAFDSLLQSHGHDGEDDGQAAEAVAPERADLDELSLALRLAGSGTVAGSGVFELGISLREIPELTFELDSSGFEQSGLSNSVLGADLTFDFPHEGPGAGWSLGLEALLFDGDIGGVVNDNGTPGDASDDLLEILDDEASGYYAWAERSISAKNSVGLLLGAFERPEPGLPVDREFTLFFTRRRSDSSRLRLALTQVDSDSDGDETRLMIQFTNFLGAHAHADH